VDVLGFEEGWWSHGKLQRRYLYYRQPQEKQDVGKEKDRWRVGWTGAAWQLQGPGVYGYLQGEGLSALVVAAVVMVAVVMIVVAVA
jgi:hypothetical protein